MYAVYHGAEGLVRIARRTHRLAAILKAGLGRLGFAVPTAAFFDTIAVATGERTQRILDDGVARGVNFRRIDAATIGIALDETTTRDDVERIFAVFHGGAAPVTVAALDAEVADALPPALVRTSPFLTHPVFRRYHSETEMLRYLRRLADRDLALDRAMIPLGSCTMKLNATSEMIPVTWPEFGALHPFAPAAQAAGYRADDRRPRAHAVRVHGLRRGVAAAERRFAGRVRGPARDPRMAREPRRRRIATCASFPRPRTAPIRRRRRWPACTSSSSRATRHGNVDLADLEAKAAAHAGALAAIMVTYPSTHGVFEAGIRRLCEIVHAHGGQVYVDGANLNALVGLAAPGHFGADVSHLNLHKTFCIPHGGGGPGVGPVAVKAHLAPFLPGHFALAPALTPSPSPASGRGEMLSGGVCRRRRDRARGNGHRQLRCRKWDRGRIRRAVRQRVDPADLVDVRDDDGRARACAPRPRARSSPPTTSRGGSRRTTRSCSRDRAASSRTSASSTCARSRRRRPSRPRTSRSASSTTASTRRR